MWILANIIWNPTGQNYNTYGDLSYIYLYNLISYDNSFKVYSRKLSYIY